MSKVRTLLAALALILAMLVPTAPAFASAADDDPPANGGGTCGISCGEVGDSTDGEETVENPGQDGEGSDGGGTTGPRQCYAGEFHIPCAIDGWFWSDSRNCYLKAIAPQPAEGETPPNWHPPLLAAGEGPGVWYDCANLYCPPSNRLPGPCNVVPVWIPGGEPTIDPGVAAASVAARLVVHPIDVGMAPRVNPEWGHRRTHVGVPVWMWVANPGQGTSEGWSVSDSEGGLSVTGTMRVGSFVWDMGDGTKVTCGTAGQPYQSGFGWRESPDCGHVYSRTSADQPDDRYTVTQTTNWVFEWTAGGRSGSIPMTTTSSTQVEVNELQTVNTSPEG